MFDGYGNGNDNGCWRQMGNIGANTHGGATEETASTAAAAAAAAVIPAGMYVCMYVCAWCISSYCNPISHIAVCLNDFKVIKTINDNDNLMIVNNKNGDPKIMRVIHKVQLGTERECRQFNDSEFCRVKHRCVLHPTLLFQNKDKIIMIFGCVLLSAAVVAAQHYSQP